MEIGKEREMERQIDGKMAGWQEKKMEWWQERKLARKRE